MACLSLAAFKILSLLFYSLIYNLSPCGLPCLMFMCLESMPIKGHNNGQELNDYNLMINNNGQESSISRTSSVYCA